MGPGESIQCLECSDGMTLFATEEELLNHKWSMIKSTKRKTHMRCHVCKLDHRTFEGLVRHYQLCHPAKQRLNCPGCDEPFDRLHQLMNHLESNACPVIMAERIRQKRMLEVHATNMLAEAATGAMPSSQPVRGGIESGPHTTNDIRRVQSERERLQASRRGRLLEDEAGAVAEMDRPIFNHGGITLGDFGGFINIKPKEAEAMAVAVAAEGEHQARLVQGRAYYLHDGPDGGSLSSRRVPPTSAEAVEEMLQNKLQLGWADPADRKGKGKATGSGDGNDEPLDLFGARPASRTGENAKADDPKQAIREFRKGDAKVPDLLTDDTSPTTQRFKGLQVWAGQEATGMHEAVARRAPSSARGPATNAATTRPGTAAGTRPGTAAGARPGTAAASSASVAGGTIVGADMEHDADAWLDVSEFRNPFSGRYSCPHDMCTRSGKQYKTSGALIAHLRSKAAHSTERQQCPSCFGWFQSLNALTQHIESQSTRCNFRQTDEFVPFVNILSAGVADVQGHNADMTLAYAVQPTSADGLLEDGLQSADSTYEESVW